MIRALLNSTNEGNLLLSDQAMVPKLRLPFIKDGYRRPWLTPLECIKSVFHFHNETCNIWSHFIPFILLLGTYLRYFSENSIFNPLMWPLLCFVLLSSYVFLMSSFAHTLCVLSPKSVGLKGWSDTDMDDLFFSLDYAGISMLNFGFGQGYIFYTGVSESTASTYINLFLTVSIMASNGTTYMAITSYIYREKMTTFTWQIFFVIPYMISVSPFLLRLYRNKIEENLSNMFFIQMFLFLLAASLHGLKLPERLAPGHFDYVGHSHNWMHVFTASGVFQNHYLFIHVLSTTDYLPMHSITIWNTFLVLLLCTFSNIAIVIVVFCHFRNRKQKN